jgi:hypothetical protein
VVFWLTLSFRRFSCKYDAEQVLLAPGIYGNTPEGCRRLQYGNNYTCRIEEQEIQVVKKLEAYFEWAVSDDRIVGFNPWHFNTRSADQYHPVADMRIGAVQMPLVLAKLKEIGKYITHGPSNPWPMMGRGMGGG